MFCKACRQSKPDVDFYSCNKSRCKECIKESVRMNRIERIDHYRAFDRARASMPHRVAARKEYATTVAYAESHAAAAARWAQRNPDRIRAQRQVAYALRTGAMVRQPCAVCGERAHAHHPDYSKPLDVEWLCPQHHKEAHAAIARATSLPNEANHE